MKSTTLLLGLCIYMLSSPVYTVKDTVTFLSGDGIKITADTYITHEEKNTPLLVLFHQAGWSRGEYLKIAPKLNALGFNCIVVDLRSGESVNGIENETALRARQAGKNVRYVDALPDIEAALRYAKSQYSESKTIAWGSSYSAALVLHIAGVQPELVDGVLAFAPGEYFSKQGKSKSWIQETAVNIDVPVFITSARNEQCNWLAIYAAIPAKQKTTFIPTTQGNHGSRALWEQFDDSEDYWDAVNAFLSNNFL